MRDVADHKHWMSIYAKTDKDTREQTLMKYAPTKTIGYQRLPADEMIVTYLERGFVSWTEADVLLAKLETEQANIELGTQYRATWDRYWNNFQATQAEVLDGQRAFLHKHYAKMSIGEISQVLDFLESFGPAPIEEEILVEAIDAWVIENPDPSPYDSDHLGLSKKAIQLLQARQAEVVHKKPIGEVIIMLTGSDGWNDRDLRYLTTYSEDDFLEWLKSSTDTRLLYRLKAIRERFGENALGKPIIARIEAALRQIGKRSELDARRIRDGVGMVDVSRQEEQK